MNEFITIFTREKILQQIFIELNNFTELKQSLDVIIKYIKLLTDCSSVAIRLKDIDKTRGVGVYYTYDGFSSNFIEHENNIAVTDDHGNIVIDDRGNCVLQCMCGAVLNGRTSSEFPFFTEGGSFWTSRSSTLLPAFTKEFMCHFTVRGYCNICGYESMALIPIRYNGTIVGLFQINDHNTNKFTYELINFLEMIGIQTGIAIRNRMLYSDLLDKYNQLIADRGACDG